MSEKSETILKIEKQSKIIITIPSWKIHVNHFKHPGLIGHDLFAYKIGITQLFYCCMQTHKFGELLVDSFASIFGFGIFIDRIQKAFDIIGYGDGKYKASGTDDRQSHD